MGNIKIRYNYRKFSNGDNHRGIKGQSKRKEQLGAFVKVTKNKPPVAVGLKTNL